MPRLLTTSLLSAVLLSALSAPALAQDPWADYRVPADWQGHSYTPSPQDWRHLAVYQVMTDRFANGDPRNDRAHEYSTDFHADPNRHPTDGWRRTLGGDLEGLTDHLDYIKSLGFDAVWISAPLLGAEPNGYAPVTYGILDSKLGTVNDMRAFVDAAHARGMYVIVDCVANHFANWFQDQQGFNGHGYGQLQYRYPGQKEYGAPFGDPLGPNDFHNNGWINDWNDGYQLEHGELVGLDDLRTETDWVRNYVIERWSNVIRAFDVDGFRVDAIKHIRLQDMAQMTRAWRQVAASVGKTNFYMFGEAYSGDHGAVGYYTGDKGGTGTKVMNGMMDYVMYLDGVPWRLFHDRWALKHWIQGMNNGAYDMGQGDGVNRWDFGNLNLHFADNHDQPRFLSTVGDWDQMTAVTALMTMIEGVGALYYGSEQAFATGGKNGVGAYPAMFDHAFQNGNSTGDTFDMTSWLYQQIAKVMRARKRIGAGLGYGTDVQDPQNGIFAFKRGADALVAINGTGGQQTADLWFDHGSFTDMVSGTTVHGPRAQVTLPKFGVAVFVKNGDFGSLEPLVEAVSPGHAQTSGANEITIAFDRDMEALSTVAAASIEPSAGGSWSISGRTLRYTGGSFNQGWMYTVRVDRSARGLNGQAMTGGFLSRFRSTGAGAPVQVTSPEIQGNRVTFRHAGGNAATLKGSWRILGGSHGSYTASYDRTWDGGAEIPMVANNGVWEATVTLDPGHDYEYGFMVDGGWTNDPANQTHAGNGNDAFQLSAPLVSPEVGGNQVTFRYVGGSAATIKGSWRITGGSNGRYTAVYDAGWDRGAETPLVDDNGVWTLTLTLEGSQAFEYGFMVDGQWTNDPANPRHSRMGNDELTVGASPQVSGRTVTFRYSGGRQVSIKGSWQVHSGSKGSYTASHDPGWSRGAETPLAFVNGAWEITLTLDPGHDYEYGFVVDGQWTNDPENARHAGNGNDRFQLP